MKKSELLINSVFNLQRVDLLNELNVNLIKDYNQLQIIKGASDLINSSTELSPDNFRTWHSRQGFKTDRILDHFNNIIDPVSAPHPDIHKAMRIEHDEDRVDEFIEKTRDKNCTPEMLIDSVVSLHSQIIKNTEIKKIGGVK